jgi:hypothetical protein
MAENEEIETPESDDSTVDEAFAKLQKDRTNCLSAWRA